VTLGTHVDPDLERATAAAARAARPAATQAVLDAMVAGGWPERLAEDERLMDWARVVLAAAAVAADAVATAAVSAAWPHLKRATRRPTDDGR
jgi:hypothetical protein